MSGKIKALLRKLLNYLHLDLTKNLEYDRLTSKIISKVLTKNSSCVDVGSHKGEILDLFLKFAPLGRHYAFEPIPEFYNNLKKNYSERCSVYAVALSDKQGTTTFQFVKNAPAYSGIKQRKYDIENPEIDEIEVALDTLDAVLADKKIDFIKIDVEGAELSVLRGAQKIIEEQKPYILFECGLGASDFYGTQSGDVYDFFTAAGMKVSTLKGWIRNGNAGISREAFCKHFSDNSEYYFFAHP
jgi:FkbM family methyltransferase